jgi:hypothetical protein
MGQFLQSPDPAIKLARQYGIRGLFSPDLVPSIQPVTLIDDLTGGISNEPQRIAVSWGTVAAVVAERSVFRFETPPNVIAQITSVAFQPSAAVHIDVSFGSTVAAPATVFVAEYTDGRLRNRGQSPACVFAADTYAVVGPINMRFSANSSGALFLTYPVNWIVGDTGTQFDFVEFATGGSNLDFNMSIQWTEFDAVPVR